MSRKNGHAAKAARRAEREAQAPPRERTDDLQDAVNAVRRYVARRPLQARKVQATAARLQEILGPVIRSGKPTNEALAVLPPEQQAELKELAARMAELGGPRLFAAAGDPE